MCVLQQPLFFVSIARYQQHVDEARGSSSCKCNSCACERRIQLPKLVIIPPICSDMFFKVSCTIGRLMIIWSSTCFLVVSNGSPNPCTPSTMSICRRKSRRPNGDVGPWGVIAACNGWQGAWGTSAISTPGSTHASNTWCFTFTHKRCGQGSQAGRVDKLS